MKRKSFLSLLLCLLLLTSCNKIGIKDKPIPVEQIFGTYDLWNDEKITFTPSYTYVHSFIKGGNIISDTGIWYYHYFNGSQVNLIKAFDMRALSKDGKNNYYTEYMTHQFYACKHWGEIIITNGYAGDPDGAPVLKWYKKIE